MEIIEKKYVNTNHLKRGLPFKILCILLVFNIESLLTHILIISFSFQYQYQYFL